METSLIPPGWTPRRVASAVLLVLAVALSFYLLFRLRLVLLIVFAALIVTVAFEPTLRGLHRRRVARPLGVRLIYGVSLTTLAGVVALLAPAVRDALAVTVENLPRAYGALLRRLAGSQNSFLSRIAEGLPAPDDLLARSTPAAGADMPDAAVPDAWGKVTDFFFSLAALGKGTFFFASILLLSFYFMLHGERTLRGLLLLAPAGKREGLRQLARDMSQVLGAYVRGLLVTAAVVGLLSSATYWLIGLPHAAVLGVFMGIAQLLPLLGPLVGMVPPTIIALSLDSMPGTASGLAEPLVSWPMTVLWVTLATLVIEQGKNSFLAPHFISKAVGVHPMVTLLAIVAFGSLLGIGGAILAIPLASVLQLLISRYVLRPHDFSNLANPDAKRRGELGVILYRADALVHDVRKHGRNATGMELPATDEHGIEDALEAVTVDLQRMLQETAAREDLP